MNSEQNLCINYEDHYHQYNFLLILNLVIFIMLRFYDMSQLTCNSLIDIPIIVLQQISVFKFWCHILSLPPESVVRREYNTQILLDRLGKQNWVSQLMLIGNQLFDCWKTQKYIVPNRLEKMWKIIFKPFLQINRNMTFLFYIPNYVPMQPLN